MSGPASGTIAAARIGVAAGLPQPHHVRHGRHELRRVGVVAACLRCRATRASTTRSRCAFRWSTSTPSAQAAAASRASRRAACCRWARERGRRAGPDLLRARRPRADRHRRQPAARPHQPARSRRGPAGGDDVARSSRRRSAGRSASMGRAAAAILRLPTHDGRGDPLRVGGKGLRPARLRDLRLRRRRPAARGRAGARARRPQDPRAGPPASPRRSAGCSPTCATTS